MARSLLPTYSVEWSPRAKRDVDAIHASIAIDAPLAAVRFTERLVAAGDSLERHPRRGRAKGKAREFVIVPPYVIRYRIAGSLVVILRVKHGSRR